MDKDKEPAQPQEGQEAEPEENQAPDEPEGQEETLEQLQARLEKEKAEAIRQVTARAHKAEADKKALEGQLNDLRRDKPPENNPPKETPSEEIKPLDVEDYIDISAALDGLDQIEKAKLAKEHKMSGRSLAEIRKDEDFLLWQEAYRAKVEKEKSAMPPSTQQPEQDKPQTLSEKLRSAKTPEDKEKILSEYGLYKSPRPRADRTVIGQGQVKF